MFKFLLTLLTLITPVLSGIDPCLCVRESLCIHKNDLVIDGCHKRGGISYCFVNGGGKCKYAKKSISCFDNNDNNLYYLVWHASNCPNNNFIDEYDFDEYTITEL
jgi:hypothetical protein